MSTEDFSFLKKSLELISPGANPFKGIVKIFKYNISNNRFMS